VVVDEEYSIRGSMEWKDSCELRLKNSYPDVIFFIIIFKKILN
jgi:hypothetical protein